MIQTVTTQAWGADGSERSACLLRCAGGEKAINTCETVNLWHCWGMKNITLSVDDDTYRMARIKAAERGTSVSALVKSYLLQMTCGGNPESEFQRLEREERELREELRSHHFGLSAAHHLNREELYSRHEIH